MIQVDRELESQDNSEGNNKENIMSKIMIENLSSGNNPAIRGAQSISRYSNASINAKINGYYLDDVEHSVIVYVTYFMASPIPYRLNSQDFNKTVSQLNNYLQNMIKDAGNMFNIIHEDNPYYELNYYLLHDFQTVDSFSYVILTNGIVGEIKLPTYKILGKKVEISVFDIERYRRFMDGQKVVNIDADLSILGTPLSCSYASSGKDLYDTYCCILPGEVIFRLFDAYHYQLLNSNVRTYLQLRGNVNKGIMETIEKSPEYFLAYNNGISATASEVVLDENDKIKGVKDFQIVNGGQTSASIYNAKVKKGFDISGINVLAKITVIKDESNYDDIVKNISRYANTQNTIKFSDFSSNDRYNKKLAELSRRVYSPAIGSKLQTKWYYENVSGSYNNEKSNCPSTDAFEKEYPKSQYFNKTEMASYELSYQGFPAEACKGAQDAYKVFVLNLPELKEPNELDFKNLVSKKILYDTVLKIINEEVGGQGKAAMARYTVAYFSTVICENKFNLAAVWENQCISKPVENDLRKLIRQIANVLKENAIKNQKGIEMYCRMPTTWAAVKKLSFSVDNPALYSDGPVLNPVLKTRAISSRLASFATSITVGAWADMAVNTDIIGDENRSHSGMCKTMMGMAPENLSERQIAYALRIVYRFYKAGFVFSASMNEAIKENEEELAQIDKKRLSMYSNSKYYVQAKL
ncbi:MAG: AIPR family protein [Candidatus Ornithospirochaeta sp.]|nr:AIPR family protein [Candidatus Ornithospirochaeta sp.]